MKNYEIKVTGIVQGVGFRPFVYKLAKSLDLKGTVSNIDSNVLIEVEGHLDRIDELLKRIKTEAPHNSVIKEISVNERIVKGFDYFTIVESSAKGEGNSYISPDISICKNCRDELFNSNNSRYLYPFINCTDCGPRFTIVEGTPYDRVKTTMRVFEMCPRCNFEYNDPDDRRYHAQPISCHNCGPNVRVDDEFKGDLFERAAEYINDGKILAIKGLGGYHLACDAKNKEAVDRLRNRKVRDEKPFAVMVSDVLKASEYCIVNDDEKRLLESEAAPIVLLRKRDDISIPQNIAPQNPYLGAMLAYTPLHLILLEKCKTDILVMTSGNMSDEPIYYKDNDAIQGLLDIADHFLSHDREIFTRTDDSVARIFNGKSYILRRSRGYVPSPITVPFLKANTKGVLACGGELKNTFCISKGNEFYLSHHIGDLSNIETLNSFKEGIEHFKNILKADLETVAYDIHPDYMSSRHAISYKDLRLFPVQHHHAHIASCMAENSIEGNVIGVAFDGTGMGEDGSIWGGEFFTGGFDGFERAAHLEYVRMPGGDRAVKEPWRMAISYLSVCYDDFYGKINKEFGINIKGLTLLEDVEASRIRAVAGIMEKNINSPLTSSMGRLFDAVAAILGVKSVISYEGQAAIMMEFASYIESCGEYKYLVSSKNDILIINTNQTIAGIVNDIRDGVDKGIIISKFHQTIASIVLSCCTMIREKTGFERVALSGGVFQNMILLDRCVKALENKGFAVFIHTRVPANDGGIALGQAVMAAWQTQKNND